MQPHETKAYGAETSDSLLKPLIITRREPAPHDIEIEILYCGVCHSDLHMARNEWHNTVFPIVPGHEIVGRVISAGRHVNKFGKGDMVAVGCMVDSCRTCPHCNEGLEQYCDLGKTLTYNSPDTHLGAHTLGGYSERIVVDEHFVLRVPDNLDPAAAAPLLCAGVTTWSPLRHWRVGPGKKVGVVGIGGLGHMGIKLAKALGAHVVVFTTSRSKFDDARRLGGDEVVLSTDIHEMKKHRNTLNFILDCVSAEHPINDYMSLLTTDGTLVLVGAPEKPMPVSAFSLIPGRRSLAGSNIGGIRETQEMLDFCGEHNLVADIELIGIQDINSAYERLVKGDVQYRFVIDMASLKA